MPKKAVFLFFLICCPLKEVFSQTDLDKGINFTKSLIANHEYNRALLELERINFINPTYFNPLQFKITTDYLNFQCKYYNKIVLANGQNYDQIFVIDSAIVLKDYKNAETIINNIYNELLQKEIKEKEEFKRMLENRLIFSNLMQTFPKKINYMNLSGDASIDIYNTYNSHRNEINSEMLAVFFGIIPGGGYAYSGDIYTGLAALGVIAACAGLSYGSIRSGMKPVGVVFALAGTFFYGGSIYGGYRSVLRNNAAVTNRAHSEFVETLRFSEDREYIFKNHGLFK